MKNKRSLGIIILALFSLGLLTPVTAAQEATATTSAPTDTATLVPPTGTPTETLTPTLIPSPTATTACADAFEPNDLPGSGAILIINEIVGELTLAAPQDVDHFLLWAKTGQFYEVSTGTTDGVDTRVRIFNPEGDLLAENDDHTPGNPAARVRFQAAAEGWLYVAVDSLVPIDWGCRVYTLQVTDVPAPTATPTPTPAPSKTPAPTGTAPPTATPLPVLHDTYEPNYDPQTATAIGVGQTLDLNFFPFPPGQAAIDNDFFQLWVKVGQQLRFETTDLAPGLDTNLILYRADGSVIGGNDDCRPGERRSCLDWAPDMTGLVLVLVGPVGPAPAGDTPDTRAYRLRVTDLLAVSETPDEPQTSGSGGSGSGGGQATAVPSPSVTPVAPTPAGPVRVRAFSVAQPTPTAVPLEPLTIQVTIYHDANDNQAADIDEGVLGLNVVILDSLTNRLLGQAFTDRQGHARLFVSAHDTVRLSVPYLGYNQTVRPPGSEVEIRLPGLPLPSIIP